VADGSGDGRCDGRAVAGRAPVGVGAAAGAGGAETGGDGAGVTVAGVLNTWDTRRITDDAAPSGDWDVPTSASEPVRSAATPNPAAARPTDIRRRGLSSAAQRDWRADGLGPTHVEDPRSTSVLMSSSSSCRILMRLSRQRTRRPFSSVSLRRVPAHLGEGV